jgi:multimeric flavodoxin WrbA
MHQAIILNASPRKKWNTAQMLCAAEKGARAAGAQTAYYDLYDLNFTGCRSCMACKKTGAQPCKCYWQDDLTPILDKIFQDAKTLIIGSPIYLGEVSSRLRAVMERMAFATLSYNDYACLYKGRLNVGVVLTMNAPEAYYKKHYQATIDRQLDMFRIFNGKLERCFAFDTMQVSDYSQYELKFWNENHKKQVHEDVFPLALQRAFEMGRLLCS